MIQLKSYGDRLAVGVYQPHSRFKRVANFVCGDSLACCVDDSVGPGPFNIVVEGIPIESIQSLSIEKKRLSINGEMLGYTRAGHYCSKLNLRTAVDNEKLSGSLKYFKDNLIRLSGPLSLTFMLDPRKENAFTTALEIEYVRRFKTAIELFYGKNYLEGVTRLRGLGFGLTPSGDDFLAGALAALNLSRSINKTEVADKISQICKAACGQNILANAFLGCAKDGFFSLRFKNLIAAILRGGLLDINRGTQQLMDFGKTSGADWGVGFYLTMQAEFCGAKD